MEYQVKEIPGYNGKYTIDTNGVITNTESGNSVVLPDYDKHCKKIIANILYKKNFKVNKSLSFDELKKRFTLRHSKIVSITGLTMHSKITIDCEYHGKSTKTIFSSIRAKDGCRKCSNAYSSVDFKYLTKEQIKEFLKIKGSGKKLRNSKLQFHAKHLTYFWCIRTLWKQCSDDGTKLSVIEIKNNLSEKDYLTWKEIHIKKRNNTLKIKKVNNEINTRN